MSGEYVVVPVPLFVFLVWLDVLLLAGWIIGWQRAAAPNVRSAWVVLIGALTFLVVFGAALFLSLRQGSLWGAALAFPIGVLAAALAWLVFRAGLYVGCTAKMLCARFARETRRTATG